MFKMVEWSKHLDLSYFYKTAETKGFKNNASQKLLIDSLAKENQWQVWILYYNNLPIGSVGAHSFLEMGENSYRIAARTCVFTDHIDNNYGKCLKTVFGITRHQNPTSQFLIPTCIRWAPKSANLYITTNNSSIGTQNAVHKIFAPALEKKGLLKRANELFYRGTQQTVWQIYGEKFLEDLEKYPKW